MVTGQEDHMVNTETLAKIAQQNPDMFWYLGSVYTQHMFGTMGGYTEVLDWAKVLIKNGIVNFYSPILHWHELSHAAGMNAIDHDLWMRIDEAAMARCDGMIYCMMTNHHKSKGLAHEVKFFQNANKPVLYWEKWF